ncbi:MAG: AraC family transcriptional regulator [Paludibacter sp.]|nr:AraC family transcriptional regulator [Paludibacter sp.]
MHNNNPKSTYMKATFKQYTPAELYINMNEPDTFEADGPNETPTNGFRPTGGAFLDAFVGDLHLHGIHTGDYHAALLGIKRVEMCISVLTLTGMSYTDFTEAYVLLMAADLLKDNKKELRDVAKRLGFGSYSGFYRFMMRKGMGRPSWV